MALKQPLPNKQLVLMTDASFTAAGYAILTEDDPNQKDSSVKKSYAPIAYGSKTFTPSQLKMYIYAKQFLAIYYAFKDFGHIFWGAPKPITILTDNKSVTRFFQTKIIPPTLWNACDYVIQFNFVISRSMSNRQALQRRNRFSSRSKMMRQKLKFWNVKNKAELTRLPTKALFKLTQYLKT